MPETSPTPGKSAAAQYWDAVNDPQNLEREKDESAKLRLADEIQFARTPDYCAARNWLVNGADSRKRVMDLGAGFGANTIALAQDGLRMIAVDTSPGRLKQLRRRAAEAKSTGDAVVAVVAAAEALPFAKGSLGGVYTKSVLIHTDLPRAAAEIHRVLAPDARAALVEPQPANPFAFLYRRVLAPKAWASITRYFDPEAQQIFLRQFGGGEIRAFYLFSFLAFVFQFAIPHPALFRIALAPLHVIDRLLFALIPPLRRLAWLGVIRLQKGVNRTPES